VQEFRVSQPDLYLVRTPSSPIHATVTVPGSKSITNRALVLAALSSPGRTCHLKGALRSEDTEVMVDCLKRLGFVVHENWDACQIEVGAPCGGGVVPVSEADLYVANSGTTMRFITALAGLGHGHYRFDGVPRMRERPIADLLEALRQLGVQATSVTGNGCPPVILEASGYRAGRVRIKGDISSQFLSGLLLAAAFAREDLEIEVEGTLVSIPYVQMTLDMMRQFGARVVTNDLRTFHIPAQQPCGLKSYTIEPDASSASYFWAAAAITEGDVTVRDANRQSLQGDVRFVDLLASMGCRVEDRAEGIRVVGGTLRGIQADMNDISDTVMTLAAVACFAEGPTTITNVAHIRHKETDRIAALAKELRKFGVGVEEFQDGLTIHPGPLHGARAATYRDHRMAMSLALLGLRVPGVLIEDPGCVSKTYPNFFSDFERLV
jgi:3-phosphoshikimate 1-carboxyvinyltransferase